MKVIAPSTTVTGKFPVISDNIGRNSLVTSPVGAVYTDDGQTLQAGLSVTVTGPTDYVYGYSATAPSTPGYYAVRLDGTDATGRDGSSAERNVPKVPKECGLGHESRDGRSF